jgi:hypothetical protein
VILTSKQNTCGGKDSIENKLYYSPFGVVVCHDRNYLILFSVVLQDTIPYTMFVV